MTPRDSLILIVGMTVGGAAFLSLCFHGITRGGEWGKAMWVRWRLDRRIDLR
jgi:hypothetical protein